MPEDSIVKYIASQLQQGYARESITSSLLASGWSRQEIKKAFDHLDAGKKGTPLLAVLALLFSFLIPLLGLILAIISLRKKEGGKAIAVAAIVVGIVLGVIQVLVIFILIMKLFSSFAAKGQGSAPAHPATAYYEKSRMADVARDECQYLCSAIMDEQTMLTFCSTFKKVDWNNDGVTEGAGSYGRWHFCEKKIPCFILAPDCKYGQYDGDKCRKVIAKLGPDTYESFLRGVDGEDPDINNNDVIDTFKEHVKAVKDGCNLPYSGSCKIEEPGCNMPDELVPTKNNWKELFCFNATLSQVTDTSFKCSRSDSNLRKSKKNPAPDPMTTLDSGLPDLIITNISYGPDPTFKGSTEFSIFIKNIGTAPYEGDFQIELAKTDAEVKNNHFSSSQTYTTHLNAEEKQIFSMIDDYPKDIEKLVFRINTSSVRMEYNDKREVVEKIIIIEELNVENNIYELI